MKKLFVVLMAAFLSAGLSSRAVEVSPDSSPKESEKTEMKAGEHRCTVTVYARSSRSTWPYESAKVCGDVGPGFTDEVRADSKGQATLVWHRNTDLKAIYIKGTRFNDTFVKFEGKYEDGGSYTFYIDL